ncbi:MAG TPA: SCP2 sterol-binding domain-containing protein [Steroidobacteraceae bacterium]|nr:SCP2 sterol-binding domain-containing protein [Steroidobacteraceae bacterium]
MTPDLLRPFASVLNRNIAASARARGLLAQVAGRSIEFRITSTPVRLRVVAGALGISIEAGGDMPPDATIEGSPLMFARLATGDAMQSLRAGGAQISGDAEIAQVFQKLFAAARPDFEEELSRVTGDVAAHEIAGFARGALAFGRRARDTFAANMAEYLTEESRDLPTRIEVDEFLADVDRLREATGRLEARLAAIGKPRGAA